MLMITLVAIKISERKSQILPSRFPGTEMRMRYAVYRSIANKNILCLPFSNVIRVN